MRTAVPEVATRNHDLAGRDHPPDTPGFPLPRFPKPEAFEMPEAIEVLGRPARATGARAQRWRRIASPTSARTSTSSHAHHWLESAFSPEADSILAVCDELRIVIEYVKFEEIRNEIEILKDEVTITEQKLQAACDEASKEHDCLLDMLLPAAVRAGVLRRPVATGWQQRAAAAEPKAQPQKLPSGIPGW
jgi:hypothetical protein